MKNLKIKIISSILSLVVLFSGIIGSSPVYASEDLQGLKAIGNQPRTRGIGATAGCIGALLGVNGVVAYLIAGTCTTACAAAPVTGAVCAACIGGICVIGAADIGAIIACFKL